MPGKNTIKTYIKNGYYHLYNRGVEKRTIYEDVQDYKVFLKYLKEYLSPPRDPHKLKTTIYVQGASFKGIPRQPRNYNKEIELIAYCLMPNHFHLLIKQHSKYSIEKFMRSLSTRYSMYFNKKYNRIGKLFQGHYKAILIKNDSYLLHLSRYIHLNPKEINIELTNAYSSYPDYIGLRRTKWIHPKIVTDFFSKEIIPELTKVNSYKKFVENSKADPSHQLGNLTLEDEEN